MAHDTPSDRQRSPNRRPRSPSAQSDHSRSGKRSRNGGQDISRSRHHSPDSSDSAEDRERRKRRRRSRSRERGSRHHRRRRSMGPSEDGGAKAKHGRRSRSRSRERDRRRSRSRDRDAVRERRRDRSRERDRRRDPDESSSYRSSKRARSRSPYRSSRRSRRDSRSPRPHRSRSRPTHKRRRRSPIDDSPPPATRRSNKPLPSQEMSFQSNNKDVVRGEPEAEKQKPNYKPSGLLAKESNTITKGGEKVVLKYNEPPDARLPPKSDDWRLFIFKGDDDLGSVPLSTRSCWLIGRDQLVADLHVQHPSTSGQHAVIQFRHTTRQNEYGDKNSKVRPYLIDIESSNGTFLNGRRQEATKYIELLPNDILKFGSSEREYVLMKTPLEKK